MAPKFSAFIDWLRYTVPVDTDRQEYLPPVSAFDDTGEVLASYPNYDSTRAFVCGRADWNAARPEQKLMITLTGKDLQRMRDTGYSDVALLNWIHDIPGIKITRLDLAIDSSDMRISPKRLVDDWGTERFHTRARAMSEVKSEDRAGQYAGHTVYIGSRTSEQFARVYDKAAESGGGGHLTRIELELKGHKAYEALVAIVRHGTADAIVGAFRRFFSWSNAGWQDIMSSNVIQVERLAEEEPDGREAWLHNVALKAVLDAYRTGDTVVRGRIDALLG